jgi:hypothetical protein
VTLAAACEGRAGASSLCPTRGLPSSGVCAGSSAILSLKVIGNRSRKELGVVSLTE